MATVVHIKKNPENHKLGRRLEELLQEINVNIVFLEAKNGETPVKEVNPNNKTQIANSSLHCLSQSDQV